MILNSFFSYRKYFSRAYLDSCLSHALNVPLNDEGHISVIDEEQFVMTLDLLVKMINIHERQKCGIPVIISSETGVGKTCLLDMLAVLWNQSLLNALNKKKSSLIDLLITKLQCVSDLEKELQTAEGTCPVKRLVPADIVEVNSVLNALKDLHCTSLMFDSLLHVLDLSDPHEPSQALYQLFCYRLLEEQYDPLFALVVFPDNMPGDIDIMHLFERLALHDVSFFNCKRVMGISIIILIHRPMLQPDYCMGYSLENLRRCSTNFVFMLVCYGISYCSSHHTSVHSSSDS